MSTTPIQIFIATYDNEAAITAEVVDDDEDAASATDSEGSQ